MNLRYTGVEVKKRGSGDGIVQLAETNSLRGLRSGWWYLEFSTNENIYKTETDSQT